ncbi:hypothetical protein FOZ62_017793, partial [Perkinsus olseni]
QMCPTGVHGLVEEIRLLVMEVAAWDNVVLWDFLQSRVELLNPSCSGLVHGSFGVRGDSTLNGSNDDPSYLRLPIPACASKNSSPMDIGLSPEGLSDPSPKDEE